MGYSCTDVATIYTIGFSGKNQGVFMDILNAVNIKTLVDIRIWRQSRFVPWANGARLAAALGDRYRYMPELAPTKELLAGYKDGVIDWLGYARTFNGILASGKVDSLFTLSDIDKLCFLCAEKTADRCHRRLVAEYLAQCFPNVRIVHL